MIEFVPESESNPPESVSEELTELVNGDIVPLEKQVVTLAEMVVMYQKTALKACQINRDILMQIKGSPN